MQKKKENKKPRGKEGNIYKVCSIEPRDKMPTYSRVQWESQSAIVRLTCFGGFCVFLLVKKVLNTKRKESAQRRKEFVLVGCFYLEKGVQTIIKCFVF